MKINLELIHGSFFFLDTLALLRGAPQEFEFDENNVAIVSALVNGVNAGLLKTDADVAELAKLVTEPVISEENTTVDTAVTELADAAVVEVVVEGEATDARLEAILAGSTKIIEAKLKEATLTAEDKVELIKLEKAGRSRPAILTLIEKA